MAEGYTYNAIAEHPIIPEYDDNEIKYKWNGALLNLSDLPVNEYTKTVFNITGSVTGETTVTGNAINVNTVNTGDTYELVVSMQYPSNSNIELTLTVTGEDEPVKILIPAGSISEKVTLRTPSQSPAPTISDPVVSPVKDADYAYQVVLPEVILDKFKAYHGVYIQKSISAMTSEDIATMDVDMIDSEGTVLKFAIPLRDVQIEEAQISDYKYALILALPKTVYDAGSYSLLEHTFQSPSEFEKLGDVVIGTSMFTVLYRVGEDMEFVSRYMKEIEYEFDLKYTE